MPVKIKFGTDGWRGIIGKDFNLTNVAVVAQAISDYLTQNPKPKTQNLKVAVGYDTRRLSRQTACLISRVLAANKIKVLLSDGPLPTQAISYTVKSRRLTLGIMVTASHNPPRFNGIKIKDESGGSARIAITNRVESLISKHKPKEISVGKARRLKLLKKTNLVSGYLSFLKSYLDIPLLKKGRLKVLVDPMHGAGNSYIAMILKNTPCKVITVHKDYDYLFGGVKPEPIYSCLKETSSLIIKKRFDIALATDGDADRIAALDAKGRFVSPQRIISLLLLHLIRHRGLKGAVVKTISGTTLLERIAKKHKLKVYETPVGFKYISLHMRNKDVLIGGEEGGGIGFKNYIPERDGILAGLLILEMMIARDKSLTALLNDVEKEFGRYFYLRKDLKCPPSDKAKVTSRLSGMRKRKALLGAKIIKVKDCDGLKFYLASGSWILFRLSGTEPIMRIYAESDKLARTKQLIAEGERILDL